MGRVVRLAPMSARLPASLCLALGLLCLAGAAWAQVYRCTSPGGPVSYQDTPCPRRQRQQVMDLSTAPASTAPAATAGAEPLPAATAPIEVSAAPAAAPLPAMYACRDYDTGRPYLSDNLPPPREVPLGALGYPGESLARAYGAGGVGPSAPELARKPRLNPNGPLIANAMVEVQDPCVPATPAQVCGELQRRLDANHEKMRMAFPRERAPYEQRERQLQAEMQRC
jgi:Domain of unknown function (DUF4124)